MHTDHATIRACSERCLWPLVVELRQSSAAAVPAEAALPLAAEVAAGSSLLIDPSL